MNALPHIKVDDESTRSVSAQKPLPGAGLLATLSMRRGPRERAHGVILAIMISALLVVPCFWHSRIQAGDFSSHVYNAWLAGDIEQHKPAGLEISDPWTNVLFDRVLIVCMSWFGPGLGQQVSLSLLVLNFFWSAFALIRTAAASRPVFLMPVLATLGYGLAFHYGFCNFYLSFGLCLWAFAVLWRPSLGRLKVALPLLAVASTAHVLPVAWTIGSIGFLTFARSKRGLRFYGLVVVCASGVLLARVILMSYFQGIWNPLQWILLTGADQVWIFGWKFFFLASALFFLWLLLFLRLPSNADTQALWALLLLTSAAVVLLPGAVFLPGYKSALSFISDRMSLATAVLVCVIAARARPSWFEQGLSVLICAIFFSFLYVDTKAFNGVEDAFEAAVSSLPPDRRVVSGLGTRDSRIDPLSHMVDRACVGRCYSYANYEPSTAQFRIRATGLNGIVVDQFADSAAIQRGEYVVKKRDLPLYKLEFCDAKGTSICVRGLSAGEVTGMSRLQVAPTFW